MSSVLIVDDNPELLSLYERSFPVLADDLQVIVATNGVQGLRRFYANEPRPACVVIDVKMPELDGNQLVRALRGDPDTADTPVIILTAMAQSEYRLMGMAAGTDTYLTKPVSPYELIAAIHQAVAISSEQREHNYQTFSEHLLADPEG